MSTTHLPIVDTPAVRQAIVRTIRLRSERVARTEGVELTSALLQRVTADHVAGLARETGNTVEAISALVDAALLNFVTEALAV